MPQSAKNTEIVRCMEKLVFWLNQGWTVKEAFTKAEQSYSHSIAVAAIKQLTR
jgi:hypothetical protein